jgi:predicted RNA methylase
LKTLDLNKDWQQYRPTICGSFFDGYQKYGYSSRTLVPSVGTVLEKKSKLIHEWLRLYAKDATVLDLGCANMYFSLMAKTMGAKKVLGIDVDKDYVREVSKFIRINHISNMKIKEQNVLKVRKKADVVFALALLHWIYSCSAFSGSLEKSLRFLSKRTKKILFVEWVDPKDQAIQEFGHIYYNMEDTAGDYNAETFREVLRSEFKAVEFLGNSQEHRSMWVCRK